MINHLAIIMDWNRRWAKSKMLPRLAWHKAGADNVVKITKLCDEKGIKYLTLWALSTENLIKRDKKEVDGIIKLINNIRFFLWEMLKERVKFNVIWDIIKLPKESQKVLKEVIEETKNNNWITLTIALIYWWQDEIIRATKKIIKSWLNPEDINSEIFKSFLDTKSLPNPDIIVRTWWDIRHSWFLLFDSAYSEYYFTQKKWPEFNKNELEKVIDFFNSSKRNFGK